MGIFQNLPLNLCEEFFYREGNIGLKPFGPSSLKFGFQ